MTSCLEGGLTCVVGNSMNEFMPKNKPFGKDISGTSIE